MGRKLIIDEDSIYEIDEMCMRRKERGNADGGRQSQSGNQVKTGNAKSDSVEQENAQKKARRK